MLTDVGALALALFATWIAARPPTPAKTYGYYRAEILAALVNALLLLVVSGAILSRRGVAGACPRPVLAGPMAIVALGGLGVNLICARLLHHGAAHSLNVRAAYLEVMSDALSSLATLVAAGSCCRPAGRGADPLASAAIALLIVPRTWSLLKQAVNVLLEGTPPHLELGEIEAAMCAVAGVRHVHDLHVWTLTSGREAMSAHVAVEDVRESERLLETLHALLARALRHRPHHDPAGDRAAGGAADQDAGRRLSPGLQRRGSGRRVAVDRAAEAWRARRASRPRSWPRVAT